KLFTALGKIIPPVQSRPTRQTVASEPEEEIAPIVAEKRKPKLVDHMQQTAKERPDEVAKVIKTLMIE
ncbi:MAG TPA: hypothetical protein VMS71_03825, partial [Candidatus Acidoferrum sp.]|nr:hypothetical protein [Candidatus Acidoferrum sp.]